MRESLFLVVREKEMVTSLPERSYGGECVIIQVIFITQDGGWSDTPADQPGPVDHLFMWDIPHFNQMKSVHSVTILNYTIYTSTRDDVSLDIYKNMYFKMRN